MSYFGFQCCDLVTRSRIEQLVNGLEIKPLLFMEGHMEDLMERKKEAAMS